jgi:hypothetical protein
VSREDRRKNMDPNLVERIRARWARIRTARAARQTQELIDRWEQQPNMIEAVILRRRIAEREANGQHPNGD